MGSVTLTFEFNFSLGKQCRSGSSLIVVSICIIRRYHTMVEPLRSSFEAFTINSNTPCLYTPMVKCSDILSDKSLGELV